MATARNQLVLDLLDLAKNSDFQSMPDRIRTVLDQYRVQLKPGKDMPKAATAREALCQDLLAKLRYVQGAALQEGITQTLDNYRMQLKQLGQKSPQEETLAAPIEQQPEAAAIQLKPNHALSSAPLAGGPSKRQAARGQCPKCHSMGVVLAYSYAGDEYFSCIYCGYQSYRATIESELDLPLATELLGRHFNEKDEIEDND